MSQSDPVKGDIPVFPLDIQLFEMLAEQQHGKGMAKYKQPLSTHNGRSAVADALEEQVDGFRYMVQAFIEQEEIMRLIDVMEDYCTIPSERKSHVDVATMAETVGRLIVITSAYRRSDNRELVRKKIDDLGCLTRNV